MRLGPCPAGGAQIKHHDQVLQALVSRVSRGSMLTDPFFSLKSFLQTLTTSVNIDSRLSDGALLSLARKLRGVRSGTAIGEAAQRQRVATAFALSWQTAHAAFVEHTDALLSVPVPTAVLGIDETRRGKPRWVRDDDVDGVTRRWRRVDPYDTGFVDLAGDQGLLGQREGRTSQPVVDWLEGQSEQFREAILFVAIDPAAVYAKAVRTPGLLPSARPVVDHFHLVNSRTTA